MRYRILLILYVFTYGCSTAQTDQSVLQKEALGKLKEKQQNVSGILADPKYLALHPQTSFRELIKEYCTAAPLTITTSAEPGRKIKVTCSIQNASGEPVTGALVYLYQTDSKGWYAADAPHVLTNEGDMGHARLFGYVKTDAGGQFELFTVKPSGYPRSDLPAHIHVHVSAPGYRPYITEFLFDDDERLMGKIRDDAMRNQFLIAKPEPAAIPVEQAFHYSIILQKQD
jgi:protocatechuate 3,4-dioxygenase beta subunit